MEVNYTEGEKELYYFMKGYPGGFTENLIKTIMKADTNNFLKLQTIYPDLAGACWKYQNTEGYWEDLQKRVQGNG